MTPKENAERIIMDYVKKLGVTPGLLPTLGNMGMAKRHAHYVVDKIIEEIRVHLMNCYEGIDRTDHWKQVKKEIDTAFEDQR